MTINRPKNAILIAGWSAIVTAAANASWTNVTEGYDQNNENTTQETGASISGLFGGNPTFGFSATVTNISGTAGTTAALTWV